MTNTEAVHDDPRTLCPVEDDCCCSGSANCCTNVPRFRVPNPSCEPIESITAIKHAKRRECAECVAIGAQWVHLRTCQECGATLCCDDSPNHHASKHARPTKHPVIASTEPGERWLYCFPDDVFVEY